MAQECLEALQKEIEALKKELAEEKVKRGSCQTKQKETKKATEQLTNSSSMTSRKNFCGQASEAEYCSMLFVCMCVCVYVSFHT